MKKLFILLLSSTLLPAINFAQSGKRNIIKTNLFSLPLKNYNLTYERQIGKRISASLGARYMPKTEIPFKSTLIPLAQNYVDISDLYLDDLRFGNSAVTAEFRWYAGRTPLRGFYVAPYFRYATLDLVLPLSNPSNVEGGVTYPPIFFNGKIASYNAGIMFGVQSNLSKRLVLDFWLVGAHVGISKGALLSNDIDPVMNAAAQLDLQDRLDSFNDPGIFSFDNKITSSTSAEIKSTGRWYGIRMFSLSLGYRF